jgi:hypothetical protein
MCALHLAAAPNYTAQEEEMVMYMRSEDCVEKMELGFVSTPLMASWSKLADFPSMPEEKVGLQFCRMLKMCRQFYVSFLTSHNLGNQAMFYNTWARSVLTLDRAVEALIAKESPLLGDFILVATVCMAITLKDESQTRMALPRDFSMFLKMFTTQFEQQLQVPPFQRFPRTEKMYKEAEIAVMEALRWDLPSTDTYTVISSLVMRADILTENTYNVPMREVFASAVAAFAEMSGNGRAGGNGYALARRLVLNEMRPALFPQMTADFLAKWKELAAPALEV